MRKLTTYIFAFFWIGLFAQERITLESPLIENRIFKEDGIPLINGKLLNYDSKNFPNLTIKYTLATPSVKKQITKIAQVGSDGSFKVKLDLGLGYQEVWLSVGDLYFGRIIANKDVLLELDLALLNENPVNHSGDGVVYKGTDGNMNTFVNEYELYKKEKKVLHEEDKLTIIMDNNLSKNDKEKELKKIYKKQGSLEHQFAKKNGKQFEWILTNDRIASMYSDLFSIHWGKKMSDLLKQECLAFKPIIVSNASLRYYDFLGIYFKIPNRLEIKLITERTLKDQLHESTSSEHLDQFLREYDKKRNHLRYDVEVFQSGQIQYLEQYEEELEMATMTLNLKKIDQLSKEKTKWVKVLSQPENLRLREIYINKIKESDSGTWIIKTMTKDLNDDLKVIDDMTKAIKDGNESGSISLGKEIDSAEGFIADAENVQTLIASIKAKYPEECLVLNLWAPWMSICKDDLISNKSFTQALDTLPVQMVYLAVNIDLSQEEWEKELSTFPMPGTHIYLNDRLTSEIISYFQIRKYPTYFFIDQKGNFDKDFIQNLSQFNPRKLASRIISKERL